MAITYRKPLDAVSVTISTSETLSAAADLNGMSLSSLVLPPLTTTCAVYLRASASSAGTYYPVMSSSDHGARWAVGVSAATSQGRVVLADNLAPLRYVKVEMGTTQAGAVTFQFIGRS